MKMIDIDKFEKLANEGIREAIRENEVYEKHLIPFAKKIGLYQGSKNFEEAGNKAIAWAKEKEKYNIREFYN
jgi:hypothetical protein